METEVVRLSPDTEHSLDDDGADDGDDDDGDDDGDGVDDDNSEVDYHFLHAYHLPLPFSTLSLLLSRTAL